MKLLLIITSIMMPIDLAYQQHGNDNRYLWYSNHGLPQPRMYTNVVSRVRIGQSTEKRWPFSPIWGVEPSSHSSTTHKTKITADLIMNVSACVAACPVVGEKNPVCGTNNVSYANFGMLECAQGCGVVVELSSSSSCLPQKPGFNMEKVISECISTCSVTSEYNPVCGTNNVTYRSFGLFECAKNCGTEMELSRRSSCSVPPGPNNPDLRLTTTESSKINVNGDNNDDTKNYGDGYGNANGGNVKKPSMKEVNACMQQCPMTAEVNPVCGTDGVTYTNPGKLLCTQVCGIDVKFLWFSTCSGEPLPTAPPACPYTFFIPPTKEECIRRCSVSQELKPVCGSDGITYINLESLKCKKIECGVDVDVKQLTACDVSQSTISPEVLASVFDPDFKPTTTEVPGHDYVNLDLWRSVNINHRRGNRI